MRLLEIVRGKKSSKEVIATCMQLSKRLGKIGVLVGNCRGFVGNRMFGPYRREAQFLIEEGAEVEAVDRALVELGNAIKTRRATWPVSTWAGVFARSTAILKSLESASRSPKIVSVKWAATARKREGDGTSTTRTGRLVWIPVTALVRKWSAEAGIPQRRISAEEEIVDRCIYALVNEGARILEEGYALRAVDIDIIYLNGYGFPAYRGGPMWHADTVGLRKVYQRICEFQQQDSENSGHPLLCSSAWRRPGRRWPILIRSRLQPRRAL